MDSRTVAEIVTAIFVGAAIFYFLYALISWI